MPLAHRNNTAVNLVYHGKTIRIKNKTLLYTFVSCLVGVSCPFLLIFAHGRQLSLNERLVTAVEMGDFPASIKLLQRGASPNSAQGHLCWLDRLLIRYGLNPVNTQPVIPVIVGVAENGDAKIVTALINYGADVNCRDEFGDSPLYRADPPFNPTCRILVAGERHEFDRAGTVTVLKAAGARL